MFSVIRPRYSVVRPWNMAVIPGARRRRASWPLKKAMDRLAPGTPATDGSATVTSTMNPGRLCMRRVVTDSTTATTVTSAS